MAGLSKTEFIAQQAQQARDQRKQAVQQQIAQLPQPAPMLLLSQPGITKDGTRFQRQTYIDGQWVRFWQDKPRKMLGYREHVRTLTNIVRTINLYSGNGYIFSHLGTISGIQRYAIEQSTGLFTAAIDRTPAGYVTNSKNLWQMDTIYLTSGGTSFIFAAATPTLFDLTATGAAQVYYGDPLASTQLVAASNPVNANPAAIANTQTTPAAGTLVLANGSVPAGAGDVTITTNGNLTALNYTIVGLDINGNPLTVGPSALPNNSTADTGSQFSAIGSVTISGATGTNTVSVGYLGGMQNITTSGGLVCVGPYLMLYGANGLIQWSVPGFPLDFVNPGSGAARPVPDKIVRGMPLRGTTAPAAIFWSLSACVIGNFVGSPTFWNFTTVSTSTSILSSSSVVEHNGIYYWASTTGFQRFAGVMEDLPNEFNQDFWLSNLNFSQRQKVFAVKVPRWNEIWWCGPINGSTECNFAVIYNYEKNYWYSTPLPNSGRAAGTYDDTYNFPLMSGIVKNTDTNGYSVWQHEFGLDEVSGALPLPKAIISFIETHEFSYVTPQGIGQTGAPYSMSFSILEPDFNQSGPLTLEIFSRQNPGEVNFVQPTDAVYKANGGYPIPDPTTVTNQENNLVDVKWQGRLTSFVIQSNAAGGNYEFGSPLLWVKPGDHRRTG